MEGVGENRVNSTATGWQAGSVHFIRSIGTKQFCPGHWDGTRTDRGKWCRRRGAIIAARDTVGTRTRAAHACNAFRAAFHPSPISADHPLTANPCSVARTRRRKLIKVQLIKITHFSSTGRKGWFRWPTNDRARRNWLSPLSLSLSLSFDYFPPATFVSFLPVFTWFSFFGLADEIFFPL